MELNPVYNRIQDYQERSEILRGYLDYDVKAERLEEVSKELEDPNIWNKPQEAQALGKEKSQLENIVSTIDDLTLGTESAKELLEMAEMDSDQEMVDEVIAELDRLGERLDKLEFQRMFSGELDPNNAYLEIQSGSGGTEAQDWANMILRMYLRWSDRHGFKAEITEISAGDVAGIKGATVHIQGDYAYGWLRTELGVHRLVRKSPFDSNAKRHTSFASVFISPEIDDSFEIDINPADLRIDVYRASGAGGQHVNKTESAVRITHLPTNTVTQCQNGRSQHQNKAEAMKQLRAKLYELEMLSRSAEKQELEDTKSDIGWGSQIRSYVLDSGRIKDLRTGVESGNTQGVLDGDLDQFIVASLKSGV
ncbi:peptide chain release factor 2 [Thiomicrorhabdus sp.]|uniref:peptide chain release factor 2 n=1 Tax=Thiomicrorhabdus sp. TaxID=2039724 RepID=UPI002AA639A9|nr:peptide chain release factor 2 [Thiomicrorhabdus sp.]